MAAVLLLSAATAQFFCLSAASSAMKAVVLVGGFYTHMRPLTLTLPLPLLEFCNKTLLMHQLQALKDAGVSEVVVCVHESRAENSSAFDEALRQCESALGLKITVSKESAALGTAGPLKNAEALITDGGTNDSPFFVVNSDVLCAYPLRDLLHLHVKNGREGTVLVTRSDRPSAYGALVVDERTGGVRHFVEKPETFISDLINAGVYVFSPSVFRRIAAGRAVSMNELLPGMADEEQLHSMLLTGYWVKITGTDTFLDAVGPHLEIMRHMSPQELTTSAANAAAGDGGYTTKGDVMVHASAKIGRGCVLGPRVVVGPGCELADGVRLEGVTLLKGARVRGHAIVKDSLIGWGSTIGRWAYVQDCVFGEDVAVKDGVLVHSATVLPHNKLKDSIRPSPTGEKKIVI